MVLNDVNYFLSPKGVVDESWTEGHGSTVVHRHAVVHPQVDCVVEEHDELDNTRNMGSIILFHSLLSYVWFLILKYQVRPR